MRKAQDLAVATARLEALQQFERPLRAAAASEVIGVDEVGAGPLAGPGFAAAVALPPQSRLVGVDDSKRLTAAQRQALAPQIIAAARAYAVAHVGVAAIDARGIRAACLLAMQRAVLRVLQQLGSAAGVHVLVDAHRLPQLPCKQTAVISGDRLSLSIAAASILAKTRRDALMQRLGRQFPGYGFAQHKGYGTAAHLAALQRLGPCPLHRRSYAPVRRLAAP